MKRFIKLMVLAMVAVIAVAAVCMGADAVATVAAAPAPALSGFAGFMAWLKVNENPLLKLALSITEVMALVPAFKGNGIIDSIIKCIKFLIEKTAETGDAAQQQ